MNIFFYITAAVAIASALMAITRREAMHGVLYLIAVLLAIALLFFQLGAPFIAALEIIIYAGAIVILFLFVIMMLNPKGDSRGTVLTGFFGPLVLVAILGAQWFFLAQTESSLMVTTGVGPRLLAHTFFQDYAFAIHLVALFLLVGLVGAFHLGKISEQKRSGAS